MCGIQGEALLQILVLNTRTFLTFCCQPSCRRRVLCLDEATSALDTESEAAVQQMLGHFARGRTSIIVAHRLATIRSADQIAVVGGGKVAEAGSHEELMAKGGIYASMVNLQNSAAD